MKSTPGDYATEGGRGTNFFVAHKKKYFVPTKNCYSDVGLVISLFDISEIGDSHIFPGDGSSHTRVVFRLLVFRPFIEEVLVSTVNIRIPDTRNPDSSTVAIRIPD